VTVVPGLIKALTSWQYFAVAQQELFSHAMQRNTVLIITADNRADSASTLTLTKILS
jgi:hypothetical protein